MKYVVGLVVMIGLSGCVSIKDINPHDIYSDIKLVYKDVKYVVYEIEEERERIESDGFGEKTDTNSTKE